MATAAAQVDQAQAELQQALLNLQQTRVTAPVDGTVSARLVNPGALVSPQTPVVTLNPPDVQVDATIDATQVNAIRTGAAVRISLPAFPDQTFTGTVSTVAPSVDSKTQTAAVHITPDDPGHVLKMYPGMQALVVFGGG